MTPQEFKARRLRLGMSQSALGDRLGTTKQTIIKYEDERGDGPPTMAALAITALDVPGDSGAELDLMLELHSLTDAVMNDQSADAAVESLDEIERILAKRRPTDMGYETAAREARKIAFEHLIGKIGGNVQLTKSDYRYRLAQALLGNPGKDAPRHSIRDFSAQPSPDIAVGINKPPTRRGLGSLTYDPPTPPLSGALSRLAAQKFKAKP